MKSVFNRLLTIKQGLPKNFVFNVSSLQDIIRIFVDVYLLLPILLFFCILFLFFFSMQHSKQRFLGFLK